MRFLDVFSGIGGFRMGLENAGHTCIGHIEKDKYALKSYKAIYEIKEDEYEGKDITEIEDFTELRGGSNCLQADSHANHLASQDIERDLMILGEQCSSILPKSLNKQNHRFFSLKTSKAYYRTTREKHLKPSSIRWMPLGITRNGNSLTLKTLEFHKTEKGSILQDILEKEEKSKQKRLWE